jgi:pimeloyl-[acyl-carrier protein] methyl ester esterase
LAEIIMRLVLLPGMDGTGELFKAFLSAIDGSLATTAVRYPNHTILCYDELMAYVGSAIPPSEPFVLLAESFSTPLAIRCAASNPRNLKALVICAGFVCSPVTGLGRFAASHLAPLLVRFGRSNFPSNFLSSFWLESLLVGPGASPSLLNELRSAISSVRPEVLSARLRAILSCDVRPALGQIGVPILYIQARGDRLIPRAHLKEIRRIQPGTESAIIDGPHLILEREPRQVAEVIERFLRQLP